jgi:hypothetical protein
LDNDGNVGIGTSTPRERLEVEGGNIRIQGVDGYDAPGESAYLYLGGTPNYIKATRNFGMNLGVVGVPEAVTIRHNTGYVGLGTTNPATALQVAGTVTADSFDGPIATDQLTGTILPANLGIGTITGNNLANNAVDSSKVLDNSLTAADLDTDSVGSTEIAAGAVTSSKVADGSLLGLDLAGNTVGSLQLADSISLGDAAGAGSLLVYKTASGSAAIGLYGTGTGGYQYLYQNDGQIGIYLDGDSGGGGLQYLYAADGSIGVALDGESGGAGYIAIYNTNSSTRVALDGYGTGGGGQITVSALDGSSTIELLGESSAAGLINVNNSVSQNRVIIDGEGNGGGGQMNLKAGDGGEGIILYGDSGGGGLAYLYAADGSIGMQLDGDSGGAGYLSIRNTNGSSRIVLDGQYSYGGGQVFVYNSAGSSRIQLWGQDSGGDGRVVCDVLQINGGSDLSEQFDVKAFRETLTPGAIVCIDPENPGKLVESSKPYDRTVAGVLSGAGGVKPGMMMGQTGTAADGQHPVALTGRVYCLVDADQGAIEPGDLITTSAMPGHGMKVSDHALAQGAIIGKAMTSLASGKGLVLVLVSLQ